MSLNASEIIALRSKHKAVVYERPMTEDAINFVGDIQVIDASSEPELISYLGTCPKGAGRVLITNAESITDKDLDSLAQYMKLTGEGFPGFETSKVIVVGYPGLTEKIVSYASDLVHRMDYFV